MTTASAASLDALTEAGAARTPTGQGGGCPGVANLGLRGAEPHAVRLERRRAVADARLPRLQRHTERGSPP